MKRVAVLVSGGGTNLQALLESERRGENPNGKIELVVASKPGVYALERAAIFGVESAVVSRRDYADSAAFDAALLDTLQKHSIDVVVLAGFLSVLGEKVIAAYRNKIINVHPSLIPSFCGAGYYGLRVHEAALAKGVKVTGATVHFVNEVPDGGRILLQQAVDVLPGDTPETLQKRVMEQAEWKLLPRALVYSGSAAVVYLAAYPILNAVFGTDLLMLGIYLPMLVVEPLLTYRFGRVQETMHKAVSKGLRITVGYALILFIVGCLREWLALGSVFGVQLSRSVLPMASMPAGGFIVLGVVCAVWRALARKHKEYLKTEARGTLAAHPRKEVQDQ